MTMQRKIREIITKNVLYLTLFLWLLFVLYIPIVGYVEVTEDQLGYFSDIILGSYSFLNFPLLHVIRKVDFMNFSAVQILFIALINSLILSLLIKYIYFIIIRVIKSFKERDV